MALNSASNAVRGNFNEFETTLYSGHDCDGNVSTVTSNTITNCYIITEYLYLPAIKKTDRCSGLATKRVVRQIPPW